MANSPVAALLAGVLLTASALHPGAALAAAPNLKQAALTKVDELAPQIGDVAHRIWEFSETGLEEHRSSALLADWLEREGFKVERGVAGMPTAFVATYGSGRPVIGVLAEFDALPGVGNEAVPERRPRRDGTTNGQGCGHNLFGAASTGAAIALKRIIEANHLKGTIRVYGAPAEEPDLGKVYMARAGLFDGLDAALHWHPDTVTETINDSSLALNNFQIEFFGLAAHASADPEKGRSALDALQMAAFGIELLREHVPTSVRMHYFIADGGKAANIVPDYARMVMNVRDADRAGVNQTFARVVTIADASAKAMGVTDKITVTSALHPLLINRPLAEAMQKNLTALGPILFDTADEDFAHALQRSLSLPQVGYKAPVQPLAPVSGVDRASTDVAEVSWLAPTAGFYATTAPDGVAWHSWAATAAHDTPAARKAAVYAAKALALTGVDLLTDAALRERATHAFQEQTRGRPYQLDVPLPEQPVPPPSR